MKNHKPSNTVVQLSKSDNSCSSKPSFSCPLDTLRISISMDCLQSIDFDRLKKQPYVIGSKIALGLGETKREGCSWVAHAGSGLSKGLKLSIRDSGLILDFSAKALGSDYLQGITKDNIFKILQAYEATGIVKFNSIYEAIRQAQVFRADACYHIDMLPSVVISILEDLQYKGYSPLRYSTTLALNPNSKRKPRLQVYSKAEDMKKKDRNFWQGIKDSDLGEYCKTKARVELQIQTLEGMREFFELPSHEAPKGQPVMLLSILKSSANPVSKFLNSLFDSMKHEGTMKIYQDKPATIEELEKLKDAMWYRYLLEVFGGGTVQGMALAFKELEGDYQKVNRLKKKAFDYYQGEVMLSPILEDKTRLDMIHELKIALESPAPAPLYQ